MKFKGVIFDLDGVIVHTDKYHYLAWKAIADLEGIYFDEKINDQLRGVSRMESLEIILHNSKRLYSEEEKNNLAEKKNDIYKTYLEKMSSKDVSLEVVCTLIVLKNNGVKLSIGSSSKNAKLILSKIGIMDLFDAISDGTNISKSKPDPEVFLCGAEYLGLNPSDCVIVEDAESGIDAGVKGGFKTIGIQSAANYSKTDYPIQSFKDILNIVL